MGLIFKWTTLTLTTSRTCSLLLKMEKTEARRQEIESLGVLHKSRLSGLHGQAMIDYLLEACVYLKTDDLVGWKARFMPPEEAKTVVKNIRQAPCMAPVIPLPKCKGCGAEEVVDDVPQGQYVCTECGLIQQQGVFSGDTAHCSFDRLTNTGRVYIHRYSRVVHFKTTLRLMAGDSMPEMEGEVLSRLRVELDGRGPVTVTSVQNALRRLGLSRKYRRHRWRLAALLGVKVMDEVPYDALMGMLRMFRRLEYYWNFFHDVIAPGRRVFFSYPFVFNQFAHQLGVSHLTGPHHLLKNDRLQQFQYDSYRRACVYTGFKCFQ